MDIRDLVNLVWAERETVNAHTPAFVATIAIGLVAGWTVGYFYWKQRLDFYKDANKHLAAALEGKIPAAAALRQNKPRERSQKVSIGLGLIILGLIFTAVGVLTLYVGTSPEKAATPNKTASPAPSLVPAMPRASPPIGQGAPPQSPRLLFEGYRLTPAGIQSLAEELYKIKDVVGTGDIRWMANDGQTLALATDFSKAYDRAGIENTQNLGRPNTPTESGVMVMVDDPQHAPESAQKFMTALDKVGVKHTLIKRDVGAGHFVLLIGPKPEN